MRKATMRKTTTKRHLVWLAILAPALALAACGVSSTTGTGGASGAETPVASETTQTISDTPTPGATTTAPPAVTAVPGAVTISLDKPQYHAGDLALVMIANGLAQTISATDHHTSCSLVTLEQQVNGAWQPIGLCHLLTPTRLVEIVPGSVTAQKIGISGTAGTYRVAFGYGSQTVYSQTFTVS